QQAPMPKITVLEMPLPLSLEELFIGTVKKMKITRKVYDRATGGYQTEQRIIKVPVAKGLRAGSKLKYSDIGDRHKDSTQDIHFVIQEKQHPLFKREGNDLYHNVDISLTESLCGWDRIVPTIDGKNLSVGRAGPTSSTFTETFPGLGMPNYGSPTDPGNYIVGVNIKHPDILTQAQKDSLR
ncbi:HSP40/DnaJ peptide-binding protein, partial [Glonium stellatum]